MAHDDELSAGVNKHDDELSSLHAWTISALAALFGRMAAARACGLLHQRHGRCARSVGLSCPLCQGGPRNQPFHPAMMVKVLVYGYATGVFSSRKLARKLHEDVAFRVLGAGNFPAHRTMSDFRALHLKELADLFVQVVKLAREWAWSSWARLRWTAPRSRPTPAATRR